MDLKRSDKYIALSNLVYIIHGKIFTKHIITINLKYQPQNWNETFELPDGSYSLSDIEKYISSISLKT